MFVGNFCLPVSGSGSRSHFRLPGSGSGSRIRIQGPNLNPNPIRIHSTARRIRCFCRRGQRWCREGRRAAWAWTPAPGLASSAQREESDGRPSSPPLLQVQLAAWPAYSQTIQKDYKQCFGSVYVFIWYWCGSSILGWIPVPIRIRIQSGYRLLMTKTWRKFTAKKKKFGSKLQFTVPVPVPFLGYRTEEAVSPPKRTSMNMKILIFFYFCWSFLPSWNRFQIRNTDYKDKKVLSKQRFNCVLRAACSGPINPGSSLLKFKNQARPWSYPCALS